MLRPSPIRVLFVCTGNICRSPMAEAIFQHMVNGAGLADRFAITSVGTDDEDTGLPIHRGTRQVLQQHGVPYRPDKRALLVTKTDIEQSHYILAMTRHHITELQQIAPMPPGEMRRLMEFAPTRSTLDVPDPYYTGTFDHVYTMIDAGCQGLLNHIRLHEQL